MIQNHNLECVHFDIAYTYTRFVFAGKLTADGHNNKDRLKTACSVLECRMPEEHGEDRKNWK